VPGLNATAGTWITEVRPATAAAAARLTIRQE
jgi:hypothetical protein